MKSKFFERILSCFTLIAVIWVLGTPMTFAQNNIVPLEQKTNLEENAMMELCGTVMKLNEEYTIEGSGCDKTSIAFSKGLRDCPDSKFQVPIHKYGDITPEDKSIMVMSGKMYTNMCAQINYLVEKNPSFIYLVFPTESNNLAITMASSVAYRIEISPLRAFLGGVGSPIYNNGTTKIQEDSFIRSGFERKGVGESCTRSLQNNLSCEIGMYVRVALANDPRCTWENVTKHQCKGIDISGSMIFPPSYQQIIGINGQSVTVDLNYYISANLVFTDGKLALTLPTVERKEKINHEIAR